MAFDNTPKSLRGSSSVIHIEGHKVRALFDSCSSQSFIHPRLIERCNLPIKRDTVKDKVAMASLACSMPIKGCTAADIEYQGRHYQKFILRVMDDLCCDILLGIDFQGQHQSVTYNYGGDRPPMSVCGFSTFKSLPPEPFKNLTADCHPIATKSRWYSKDDRKFIEMEVNRLLQEGIVTPSRSPWRAQVVVVKGENGKRRFVIDYSQTINKFTQLDAFPLPNMSDIINEIAPYRVYSTVDLKSAYHQVPLEKEDQKYTAFEAAGALFQFTRLPFGVTNGVACFQRAMMNLVKEENLTGVFAYLDNITICGHTQQDHDINLQKFLEAAKRRNLKLNKNKKHISNQKTSDSRPLASAKTFPLDDQSIHAFHELKRLVESAVVIAVDETLPFEVETDASDVALAATLNQGGRPVAFFSRMLQGPELKHPSIEKEARPSLRLSEIRIIYVHRNHRTKIKNDKSCDWRLELCCYSFDIRCPGQENIPSDALSRISCATVQDPENHLLYKLHDALCHPGITRMSHFIRVRNLPYSMDDIRKVVSTCPVCCECKPRFHKPDTGHLIKATQAFERLNIDFKGPLPSNNNNRYFLCVVDEFSRFPFAFPCPDVSTASVIKCLTQPFTTFGMPAFIHSDRGSAFMSRELRSFLNDKGIATSRTTPYNPAGNGQVERFNGTIWNGVKLALKSKRLPVQLWHEVLPDVLHSIRSLLCTATNETPHERVFKFSRRSMSGCSIPSWMSTPGPVLLKRYVRKSKTEPLVDEVELLEANPQYAHVRFPDGRETTVASKHLAPVGYEISMNRQGTDNINHETPLHVRDESSIQLMSPSINQGNNKTQTQEDIVENNIVSRSPSPPVLRRSTRERRTVDRLNL
uniref:uncharacterized protein LOC120327823 n=1 Tax=Styela clava TaxID=7725 RepID=UPI00193A4D42|nr:uncharacterized protein LOC120327823 [Styela clava]